MKTSRLLLVALSIGSLCACATKTRRTGEHTHIAPHGGTLVEIGDHAYTVELVRDTASGKITAYVLDGHAQNPVRITPAAIEVIAMPGGKYTPVSLKAAANPVTGETVGDTSQFEFQADWLKTAGDFSGIFTIEIRGKKFEQVAYFLPK